MKSRVVCLAGVIGLLADGLAIMAPGPSRAPALTREAILNAEYLLPDGRGRWVRPTDGHLKSYRLQGGKLMKEGIPCSPR